MWGPCDVVTGVTRESLPISFLDILFVNREITHDQEINLGIQKAIDGLLRCIDDRLSFYVERCVEKHRTASCRVEGLKELAEARIVARLDGLYAATPIYVYDSRNFLPLVGMHLTGY